MLKPITMQFIQNDGFIQNLTSAYEVRYKGWKRLEPVCSWLLHKVYDLVPHFDRQVTVTQVRIDPAKAAVDIVRLAYEQLNRLGKRPERILVGRKEFYEIAREVDIKLDSFEFNIELQEPTKYLLQDEWSNYNTRYRLFNVPLQIIPWMDGVLVL